MDDVMIGPVRPQTLGLKTFDAGCVTWDGHRGVVDISDLCGPDIEPFSPVWDDACDVGLKLKSPRTGCEVVFVEKQMTTDGAWEFISFGTSPTLHLTIYND